MKILTDEKIIALYKADNTIEQIWDKFGIPEDLIRRVLAKNGIEIREDKHGV